MKERNHLIAEKIKQSIGLESTQTPLISMFSAYLSFSLSHLKAS